jgi:hypothetical protein
LVVEGVFRKSGVVHSFKVVDPVLFVFGRFGVYKQIFSRIPNFNFQVNSSGYWGRNIGLGCLRIGYWGEYLGLRGTR